MELELGLKLTRVADEFSSADFLLAKDRAGPLFISTESHSMFILHAHLKGYSKQNIKIEINEDGSRMIIRGEKLVQENVMGLIAGRILQTKETAKREFKKAFKIPQGVILDKIKARFDDDEYMLRITIPKKEKGILGLGIQEVQEPEIAREGSGPLQIEEGKFPKEQDVMQEKDAGKEPEYAEDKPEIVSALETQEPGSNVANLDEDQKAEEAKLKGIQQENGYVESDTNKEMKRFADEGSGEEATQTPILDTHNAVEEAAQFKSGMQTEELETKKISQGTEAKSEGQHDKCPHLEQEMDQYHHKNHDVKGTDIQEDKEDDSELAKPSDKPQPEEGMPSRTQEERGKCKLCTPILAGSALLISLVAFVIHFIRAKQQPVRRKD